MKREWNISSIYLYVVSFVALMMIIVGTVKLIQCSVEFIYPRPIYYQGPAEIKLRLDRENLPQEVIMEQVRLERERQEQQARYDRARRLAETIALLVVAIPVYLYHWRTIRRKGGPPVPPEQES